MKNRTKHIVFLILILGLNSCKVENLPLKMVTNSLPDKYKTNADTTKAEVIVWKNYFNDNNLTELIDESLKNNQELNMRFREIEITAHYARNTGSIAWLKSLNHMRKLFVIIFNPIF